MTLFGLAVVPIYLACWVLAPTVFGWALLRWQKAQPRFESPMWRSYIAFAAFSFGGLSLFLYLVAWAFARGGFAYYAPALLRSYAIGLLLALVGLLFSFPGKGKLRWPASWVSSLMIILWFLALAGE
jgi:hypothetical protein